MDLKFIESRYDILCLEKRDDGSIEVMVLEDKDALTCSTNFALFNSLDLLINKLQELKEEWK